MSYIFYGYFFAICIYLPLLFFKNKQITKKKYIFANK
jgi:ABC-type phosphate/phosphonate transport system permease subunit